MSAVRTQRWPVVAGAMVGIAFGIVGLRSLVIAGDDARPAATLTWVVGLAIAHDLLLVPVVLVIGVAVKRLSPAAMRAWIGGGLLVSGAVSLVAWPLVRGYGRAAGNPSLLPRDYGTGLVTTLAIVWVATLACGMINRRRRRRASTAGSQ